ncbi:hypothetical protein SLS60_007338 [Paraconiothyrium brasiliense]|uniref:Uncharacterized protein n=1 Tax=Paraconiothyrium brasiliense TaxID=300254 RepID=A0ABR3R533_9PLEO
MTSLPITASPTLQDLAALKSLIISQARLMVCDAPPHGELDIVYVREEDGKCNAELVVYAFEGYRGGLPFVLLSFEADENNFYDALEGLWDKLMERTPERKDLEEQRDESLSSYVKMWSEE